MFPSSLIVKHDLSKLALNLLRVHYDVGGTCITLFKATRTTHFCILKIFFCFASFPPSYQTPCKYFLENIKLAPGQRMDIRSPSSTLILARNKYRAK